MPIMYTVFCPFCDRHERDRYENVMTVEDRRQRERSCIRPDCLAHRALVNRTRARRA